MPSKITIPTGSTNSSFFVRFLLSSLTLSTLIGTLIIISSMGAKTPQIIKIHQNKSGEGINIKSVTLDLTANTIYMVYNFAMAFPFSSWGDSLFLTVQTLVIAALVLSYEGEPGQATVYVMTYLAICMLMMSPLIPIDFLWILQSINIPIHFTAKLLQAHTNYTNGHTGQLSAITAFMLLFGAIGRIYTSKEATGDPMLILTHSVGAFANAIIVAQILYYWKATNTLKDE